MRSLRFAALLPFIAWAGSASGGDAPPPDPAGAAKKVRAALPVPAEGRGFEFSGDLVLAGEFAGTVHYAAESGAYHDQPVWLVTEERTEEFGGSVRRTETSLYLAKDLTLLRGESEIKTSDAVTRLSFARAGDGFDVVKSVKTETTSNETPFHAKAVPDATSGRAAVLLFLRGAPKAAATYSLPLFLPDRVAGAGNEHEAGDGTGDAILEVMGPAKYGEKPHVLDSWLVAFRFGRTGYDLHLSPKDRSLLAAPGILPTADVVPKGAAPKKTETDDDRPATSWRAAFVKFGHGYHMAIAKYLDAVFHWQTMYDYETAHGGWRKESPIAEFKRAYIDEFLKKSKHRPRSDADGLLAMTLATATVKDDEGGGKVLATHPEFGGNVFHLKPIDGVWYIVRIDQ